MRRTSELALAAGVLAFGVLTSSASAQGTPTTVVAPVGAAPAHVTSGTPVYQVQPPVAAAPAYVTSRPPVYYQVRPPVARPRVQVERSGPLRLLLGLVRPNGPEAGRHIWVDPTTGRTDGAGSKPWLRSGR
jgi:hypothetical protein